MPTYPVTSPVNGINGGLFPFHVNASFFKEWVQITPLWNFMGNEMTRPIVRHQMKAGEGWQYTVGKLNSLDYTKPVLDFNQVSGAAQTQSMDATSVGCQAISFPLVLKGKELMQLGTPINLPDAIRPQLIEAAQRNLNKGILDAATVLNYAPATQKPSYDRVVFAGYAPARNAYNALAGITTALNGMTTGVGYAQNGLSAAHLQNLKAMAVLGSAADMNGGAGAPMENGIRPAFIKTKAGFPMNDYIYLCDTATIQQLYLDPMFSQSTAARGTVIDAENQPQAINGADYHGKFFGIHIYELKDLPLYRLTSANNNYVMAWNLFIGAGAWSLGWYKEPWIAFLDNQIDMIQNFTTHEIRGQVALKFPSKVASTLAVANIGGTVEQGIIHSFVRIS